MPPFRQCSKRPRGAPPPPDRSRPSSAPHPSNPTSHCSLAFGGASGGGLDVPTDRLVARYPQTLANLRAAMRTAAGARVRQREPAAILSSDRRLRGWAGHVPGSANADLAAWGDESRGIGRTAAVLHPACSPTIHALPVERRAPREEQRGGLECEHPARGERAARGSNRRQGAAGDEDPRGPGPCALQHRLKLRHAPSLAAAAHRYRLLQPQSTLLESPAATPRRRPRTTRTRRYRHQERLPFERRGMRA